MPTHAGDLSVLDFTKSRLTDLVNIDDAAQIQALSVITFDVMTEIESCLKVRFRAKEGELIIKTDIETITNIGDESFYNMLERSFISDLVSLQYLFNLSVKLSTSIGTAADGDNPLQYIKKGQAGSAEVEFGLMEGKNMPLLSSLASLMQKFKNDAIRKAKQLGCRISLLDNGCFEMLKNKEYKPTAFLVIRSMCK